MEHLEWLLSLVANTAIIIFEFIGVGIIIYSGLTSFLKFLRRSPDTKIYLAKGLAMGLEFKMGSEILRTVVVREWKEIGIVAGIIALRAALTFLIHWEIKEEERAEYGPDTERPRETGEFSCSRGLPVSGCYHSILYAYPAHTFQNLFCLPHHLKAVLVLIPSVNIVEGRHIPGHQFQITLIGPHHVRNLLHL